MCSYRIVLWLPSDPRWAPCAIEAQGGELLIPLKDAERIGLRDCVLGSLDELDGVLTGGQLLSDGSASVGCPWGTSFRFFNEWPTKAPSAPTEFFITNDRKIRVEPWAGARTLRILQPWDGASVECKTSRYEEVVSAAREEVRKLRDELLALSAEEPDLLSAVRRSFAG